MHKLWKAILARYAASEGATLRGLTPGGMWLGQAAQDAVTAWIVLTPLGASVEHCLGTDQPIYDVSLQFSIACASASTCVSAADALVALYDNVLLTLDGTSRVLLAQNAGGTGLMRDNDSEWYTYVVQYRYLVGV